MQDDGRERNIKILMEIEGLKNLMDALTLFNCIYDRV
jgi:hypothetical protein